MRSLIGVTSVKRLRGRQNGDGPATPHAALKDRLVTANRHGPKVAEFSGVWAYIPLNQALGPDWNARQAAERENGEN
jgi:hypothetical protein